MGAGFCNLNSLKWLKQELLTPAGMHEQRSKQSHRVGREEEGMSSNRPELVDLRECLEAGDNVNLLYLTDSEATLQDINKWIGGGAKLNLAKTADADVLKAIIVKLQQRVKTRSIGDAHSMKRRTSERTWDEGNRTRKKRGVRQRIGPYTSGERSLKTKTK